MMRAMIYEAALWKFFELSLWQIHMDWFSTAIDFLTYKLGDGNSNGSILEHRAAKFSRLSFAINRILPTTCTACAGYGNRIKVV